jgi:hypothetical protein
MVGARGFAARSDMGGTDPLYQTDLVIAHEVKFGETKRLRFDANVINLFQPEKLSGTASLI